MNVFSVAIAFLKIGATGFGGGSALIPVVEKEIVTDKKWIGDNEFNTATIISNITPGALPVKLGALWNGRYSLLSSYCAALPGTLALIVLMTAFSLIGEGAVRYIENASIGISVFIVLLLYMYIDKVHRVAAEAGIFKGTLLITCIAFVLTGGQEVRHVLGVLSGSEGIHKSIPLLDISTINLMITAFFVILFVGGSKSKLKLTTGLTVGALYALASGKAAILTALSVPLQVTMIVLVSVSIIYDISRNKTERQKLNIKLSPLKNVLLHLAVGSALVAIVVVIQPDVWKFVSAAALSTATSFGGGEAYVAVAEGFFVQSGFVEGSVYYNQIVPAANALPGPILVKIAAAIGYTYGDKLGGTTFGWLTAVMGMAVTIGISSIGALIVLMCFDALGHSPRLMLIKRYILPIVCGMLISTIMTMLYEMLKIMLARGYDAPPALGIAAIIFVLMLFAHKKYHINDVLILASGGLLTLGLLHIA